MWCRVQSAGELWACVCAKAWGEGPLLRKGGSVAGETPACQGANKDTVLANYFVSLAGLWHAGLTTAGPKDYTDVAEEALV